MIDKVPQMKTVLIYTVHKAASMFLHRLATEVAKELEIRYYSINQDKYYKEINESSWLGFIENNKDVGCFGPIRAGEALPNIPLNIESNSVIMHLRDPRDVMVSLFFSSTYSHPEAGGFNISDARKKELEQQGIDKFVLDRAPKFMVYYQELISGLLGRESVVFIKYEDMVSDYATWLKQFISAFSHFNVPPKRRMKLFKTNNSWDEIYQRLYIKHKDDFNVATENIHKHIRQITPGDYKRKLQPGTIDELNRKFADVLSILDYEASDPVINKNGSS